MPKYHLCASQKSVIKQYRSHTSAQCGWDDNQGDISAHSPNMFGRVNFLEASSYCDQQQNKQVSGIIYILNLAQIIWLSPRLILLGSITSLCPFPQVKFTSALDPKRFEGRKIVLLDELCVQSFLALSISDKILLGLCPTDDTPFSDSITARRCIL